MAHGSRTHTHIIAYSERRQYHREHRKMRIKEPLKKNESKTAVKERRSKRLRNFGLPSQLFMVNGAWNNKTAAAASKSKHV